MSEVLEEALLQEEDTQKGKILTFALGKEEFGIEIRYVTEIIVMQSVTEVPELPDYVKGIINLRGRIIPVIDVRIRFGKEERDYDDRTCIVVVDIKGISVGLIVDTVVEVLSIPDQDIVPPPKVGNNDHHNYIMGIGKVGNAVKLLLDCDKLLNDDEAENLAAIS